LARTNGFRRTTTPAIPSNKRRIQTLLPGRVIGVSKTHGKPALRMGHADEESQHIPPFEKATSKQFVPLQALLAMMAGFLCGLVMAQLGSEKKNRQPRCRSNRLFC